MHCKTNFNLPVPQCLALTADYYRRFRILEGDQCEQDEYYRTTLRSLADWDEFLLKRIEIARPPSKSRVVSVVANEGTEAQFKHFLTFDAERFPANTPGES